MKWEIREHNMCGVVKCKKAVYFNGKIIPCQLIDYGKMGKKKVTFGIVADKRMDRCLTDSKIKELPTLRYSFFYNKNMDGLRCCKIWFEL